MRVRSNGGGARTLEDKRGLFAFCVALAAAGLSSSAAGPLTHPDLKSVSLAEVLDRPATSPLSLLVPTTQPAALPACASCSAA